MLLRGERSNQIYQRAICLAGFRREARETAAIILLVKLCFFGDRPSEEPLPKRTERNKADAKFFQRGNDFFLRAFPPERVFTLKRGHWLNCVCTADGLCPRFRYSEVLHLAFLNQLLRIYRHVFNQHVRIYTI